MRIVISIMREDDSKAGLEDITDAVASAAMAFGVVEVDRESISNANEIMLELPE